MSTWLQRLGLWTSCLAQLIVVLDVSVVNVALPSIQADLGLSGVAASWVALAYSLGFAGLLLVGARLADVVGTARLLAWSVAALTLASLIGGLATEGWVLIAARAAQGVSAAAASPATFTLLTTTHAEGPERTRAIAVWTAVSLAGGGFGNIASGLLTDLISWRATLLINLPIGVCVVIAALVLHRRTTDRCGAGRIDFIGAGLATAAFTCAIYAVSVAGEGVSGGLLAVVGSLAVAMFVVLVRQQRRTSHKLVPSDLAQDRLIVLGNIATALTGACFQVGLWYFLTYRMQTQFGYSPIQAGLAFLPLTASMLTVNLWFTPRLMNRHAPRVLIVIGAVVAVPGLLWLTVVDDGPFAVAVLVPTAMIGIGGGLMNTPLAALVTTGVRPEHAGAASGLMNTAKQFGGAIGLAAATTAAAIAGTDRAAFVLMSVALLAVIATASAIPAQSSEPQPAKTTGKAS
ncbi:putative drug resistance transporter [Gordonia hirsuta DSM 44140 = NBRC 16056]|uniref:Putative drug resistance transporter n=1 Tax=Gordonia hirsuta DSM 44140 = NBRC 16056 TaxID=1121927 RepID=L7LCV2_9ACTN|nr:MFS transporter [Gordonia hirsuta]GAC58744.1 putative drug resistance transporter [Gordonia hirsuta DSM 44140 = NBRC 16056]